MSHFTAKSSLCIEEASVIAFKKQRKRQIWDLGKGALVLECSLHQVCKITKRPAFLFAASLLYVAKIM